jgi:hypothetical protein
MANRWGANDPPAPVDPHPGGGVAGAPIRFVLATGTDVDPAQDGRPPVEAEGSILGVVGRLILGPVLGI